jgi:hypothetical protein
MHIAFVDETDVYLVGEKCLLYGVYVCADLDVPAQALGEIRTKHEVPNHQEIKWTIDTGNRDRNAKIKEDLLCQTHRHDDQFLVSITRGRDKVLAFHRSLNQIHDHFRSIGLNHYGPRRYPKTSRSRGTHSGAFVTTLLYAIRGRYVPSHGRDMRR